MQDNVFNTVKLAVVGACAAFSAAFGWFGWIVVAWGVCMALDYITGTCAACKAGEWSSTLAREGLWHKCGMIFAVAASGILDLVMGQLVSGIELPFRWNHVITPLVIFWYIITELGSIAENSARMGGPVPPFLRKALAAINDKLDDLGEEEK